MLSGSYSTLYKHLLSAFPKERLIHDELRTLAYGTDASFYRLIPKIVVRIESEQEVVALLHQANTLKLPVTFRAAGTSLSGQAISDSILAQLGRSWRKYKIHGKGEQVTLQPGVVGGHANAYLSPYGRKIGPDPASINSAMIGGIVSNNSSGMCCGTEQNTYRTLASMRIILSDGTSLDTGVTESKERFRATHGAMLQRVSDLASRVKNNQPLADRIRRKYTMKNTTGYSLNALVDFTDPIDIIQHLIVGSEGTLAFIAEVTLNTVPELKHKASSLMLFPDIETACHAAQLLKPRPVDAMELMDRASLRSVEEKPGMPPILKSLDSSAASLLVETRGTDETGLNAHIEDVSNTVASLKTLQSVQFTSKPEESTRLWNIRKGLFPAVGAMRKTGTTVVIEDVAFPLPSLANATLDLQRLFLKHGYRDGIIFGHARDGNLHFVFNQDFNTMPEVNRYKVFMDDVTEMVVSKYDGSLKAEHGTGRNMAPFVEMEWGSEAYRLMKEIKSIFDPGNLLNPGVILNPDPLAHVKDLKPLPAADEVVDKCIECGFCEVQCPSKDLTLTPRQRIVVYREMSRLKSTRENGDRLRALEKSYQYDGDETCATDGMCSLTCPVNIDTGKLVKKLRTQKSGEISNGIAWWAARNMKLIVGGLRFILNVTGLIHRLLGTKVMGSTARTLRKLSGGTIPMWYPEMPRGGVTPKQPAMNGLGAGRVVYFPACINRALGVTPNGQHESVTSVMMGLMRKTGYEVVIPEHVEELCCGMAFASKGFVEQGKNKTSELKNALLAASQNGKDPIVADMSPCVAHMKEAFGNSPGVYDQVEFALQFVVPRVSIRKTKETIALHPTCSTRKMGLETEMVRLAQACAENVVVPTGIGCCGWAGDRGFTFPELTESALAELPAKLPPDCKHGYSNSRTCEIGLSHHSGIRYESIIYLVERCTEGKEV